MRRLKLFIPLIIFVGLAGLFYFMLSKEGYNPQDLPSALIDRPVPEFKLPSLLDEQQLLSTADLRGEVALINVWATWCVSCRAEHPFLMQLAEREKLAIIGVDYKDEKSEALKWLEHLGNPYRLVVNDAEGRLGLDLGVYGAPESYVIDKQGIIRYKHVGVVDERVWHDKLKQLVDHLRSKG